MVLTSFAVCMAALCIKATAVRVSRARKHNAEQDVRPKACRPCLQHEGTATRYLLHETPQLFIIVRDGHFTMQSDILSGPAQQHHPAGGGRTWMEDRRELGQGRTTRSMPQPAYWREYRTVFGQVGARFLHKSDKPSQLILGVAQESDIGFQSDMKAAANARHCGSLLIPLRYEEFAR